MNNAKKDFCRFCLKIVRDENFDIIGKATLEILNVLLIEMDLNMDGKSLICCDCQDGLERCFNFKSLCLSSEDSIAKYITEDCKLELENVYLKEQLRRKSVRIPRGHKICRLCMKISRTAKCMNNPDELITLTNYILHKFIPEVNLNAVENPVICEACLLELQSYSEFITSCLDVEKMITRYYEAAGVSKRQIQLYNVLQFINNEAPKCDRNEHTVPRNIEQLVDDKSNIEINCNNIEFHIKKEEIMLKTEDEYDSNKTINCNNETGLINGGQVHFPGEQCNPHDRNRNYVDTEEKPKTLSLPRTVKEDYTDENQLEFFTNDNGRESFMGKSVVEHDIKNEEIEIKSEDADMRYNDDEVISEKPKRNRHCCQFCPFSTISSKIFDRHLLVHETPAEVIVYKCDDCSFITKFKTGLTLHTMRVHGYPLKHQELKCKLCPYKSTYLTSIRVHELTHLPPSERPKFKCSFCNFHSFDKRYFKEHLKIHDVNSESTWYRCTACSYKTVHKYHLAKHMLFHRHIPEAELYHCAHCPYKTKLKDALRCHLIKHKDESKIITFSCDKCSYKAKCKSRLVVHMNTHKSPLEHEFYKCETCRYITTRKRYLKNHILVHKDKSIVKMYRCDKCTFETRYKHWIKQHKKNVHGNSFEIKMYKCEVCPLQYKTRNALNQHSFSHKSLEEIPLYKCFSCSYQTTVKFRLREHVQTHMDQSRRLKFKCEICGRQFNHKGSLRRHNKTCIHSS